jgi:hypothetical protein
VIEIGTPGGVVGIEARRWGLRGGRRRLQEPGQRAGQGAKQRDLRAAAHGGGHRSPAAGPPWRGAEPTAGPPKAACGAGSPPAPAQRERRLASPAGECWLSAGEGTIKY